MSVMLEGIGLREALTWLALLAGVLLAMWAALALVTRAVRRYADRLEEEDREHVEEIERWAQQLIRFARRAIQVITAVVALAFLLRRLGLREVTLDWADVLLWATGQGLRILLIIIGGYVLLRLLHLFVSRLPMLVGPAAGTLAERVEQEKRLTTITRMLRWISNTLVMGIAILIILREVGIDITPILTGAGIAGLAVGFGAQNLVRDIITGFFLIIEDQVRVGDVAIINGKGGLVEAIRLRTIRLRGLDGTVHIFPNGAINEVSNLTKDFSYYVIDLGVAYKEDLDHVMSVVREVGAALQADPAFADKILAPLEILGVDAFADSAVVIKIRIKTVPLEQWNVGRELRRRIKKAFDDRGIEMPFPHLSVYFGEASKPFAVHLAEQRAQRAASEIPPSRDR